MHALPLLFLCFQTRCMCRAIKRACVVSVEHVPLTDIQRGLPPAHTRKQLCVMSLEKSVRVCVCVCTGSDVRASALVSVVCCTQSKVVCRVTLVPAHTHTRQQLCVTRKKCACVCVRVCT